MCDKRLARLISYLKCTSCHRQFCHAGNKASECKIGVFQDADVAGEMGDSKSTSGGMLCIFADYTFLPISYACKQQTAVSQSSTEAEVISLDTGLRMEGLLALTLWNVVLHVLEPPASRARRDPSRQLEAYTSQTTQETIDRVPLKC